MRSSVSSPPLQSRRHRGRFWMSSHPSSDGTGWSDPVLGCDDVSVGVFMLLCVVYRESVEATSRKMKRKDVPLHVVAEQVRCLFSVFLSY